MARNVRKELNDARLVYQDLRNDQAKFNGEMDSAQNRMTFTKGQIDALVRDGKQNTAGYRNLVKTYNEAKARYESAKEKFDAAKAKSDEAKAKMDSLDAEAKAEVAAAKRKEEAAKAAEDRKKQAGEAKSEAQALRQQAAVERDLGNTAEADRLEREAAAKESQANKPTPKTTGAPTVSTPAEATPIVQPKTSAGDDWSHGVKLGAGQVLWREGKNWVAKDQSYFFGPNGAVRADRIAEVRKALTNAGFDAGRDITELSNNFRDLIMQSSSGGYSPLEAAAWNAEYGFGGGGEGAGGGGGGAGGTRTNITIQDPRNLQQSINQVWNTYLKRDATWQEIKDVTEFVNKRIKETPSTTTYDASGSSVTRGLDTGAIGAIIINYAKSRPEAKAQKGEDFEGWIDDNAGGIKFAVLVNDPGLDAVRRLYMAGNEADALRALKQLGSVKGAEESELAGKLATAKQNLSAYATAMGVAFDVDSAAKAVADGLATDEDYKSQIKELAKSYFPAWAKQIDAGQTMQSIAYPYLNSMAQILELNPAEVNVNDPMVKKALTFRDKDGNAASQSIWDFEQSLRQDPRWGYTKNARNELDSVARSVLRDFGLVY